MARKLALLSIVAARLLAQSTCSDNLFTITSGNGTNFPAGGGATTISWHKTAGGSDSCPSFVTTASPWLSLQTANSSSTTGSSALTIAPNPSSAARSGIITVQSSANDATNFTIYQAGSTLVADVTSLTFNAAGGAAPPSQNINVTASGGAVQIAATPTSTGNWLSVTLSSSTTPAVMSVSANPANLNAGTYPGTIQIVGGGLQIPISVTLIVTAAGPTLVFNPLSLTMAGSAGAAAVQASATLKNTGAANGATFVVNTDQAWLTAASLATSTLGPGQSTSINVTANPATLAPGTYTGHVTAQATGTTATLTVTFNVTGASISALVNPISLSISSGTKKSFPGVEQLAGAANNVAISVTQGGAFLTADATAKVPGAFGITIDATTLAPGNYDGMLSVQCTGTACVPVPVQVVITVNPGTGMLNFLPSAATLSLISGAATPQTAAVTLENDGSSTTAWSISSDQNWLSATPASGSLAAAQKTTITVTTNAVNLPPGNYTGHVFAQGTSTTGTYTVNLTVSGANVTVTPNPLALALAAGTTKTFVGALQLAGDAATVSISVTQGNAYLSADALATSPGTFSVTVDASKLSPGQYSGALSLHCTPGCAAINVPVAIAVTQGATTLVFGSPGVTLNGNAGISTPQTVTTTLTNTGNTSGTFALVSDQPWLSASPATGNLAPGQAVSITLSASAQNLAAGQYTGHVTAGAASFAVVFNVAGVSLYAAPNPAAFSVPAGTRQTFNTLQVLGGAGTVNIAVTSGANWLSADPVVQAPGSFNVTIDARALTAGSYSGTLSFTCPTVCAPFSVPVSLTVTSNATLVFGPATATFSSYPGRPGPAPVTVSVKSSDGGNTTFTVANPLPWLDVSALSGLTPTTLTLTPSVNGVPPGTTMSGNLTFTTANTQAVVLYPVVFNAQAFTVSATPATLAMYAVTGQHAHATLMIGTADNGAAPLQVSTGNYWLSVPGTFTAPGAMTVNVDASTLGVGSYSGMITLSCASANLCQPLQVPLNLTVTATPLLLSDTQSITFPLASTGPTQTSQTVHLTSSDNTTPISYTISATSLPPWLAVTSDSLTTPATLTFSVPNPPPQGAKANVKIQSSYNDVAIAINYTPAPGPTINSAGVVSGGGLQARIRQGSWATIYGSNLADAPGRDWGPSDFVGSLFPTSLDGVTVTVAGKTAFVRSISPAQINFQCPDGVGTGAVPVVVTNPHGVSNTVIAVADNYAPAFLAGSSANSRNYVAATEAVNGGVVYIGPANTTGVRPAKAGESVTLWGTGFGPTTPAVPAGSLFSGSAPLNDVVQILIDGVGVTPQFAGLSAAGLYQFNIVVPNLPPGDHKLTALIAGVSTPDGIWFPTQ